MPAIEKTPEQLRGIPDAREYHTSFGGIAAEERLRKVIERGVEEQVDFVVFQ